MKPSLVPRWVLGQLVPIAPTLLCVASCEEESLPPLHSHTYSTRKM